MFHDYLTRWQLTPDGDPIITSTGHLLPVRYQRMPAMLKVVTSLEEKFGAGLMHWWNGDGAARVLEHSSDAVLLERATGTKSLVEMARAGRDDEACRIICGVVATLHSPGRPLAPPVTPLTEWFRELMPAAELHGGILTRCAKTAQELLAHPQDKRVLHGDIHHSNVLDFGERGWRAIDPKGLWGERGFDYANLFCNPDGEMATAPGKVARRADIVAEASGLDRRRLLMWVLAWSGLSAAWMLEDGEAPDHALLVADQAAAELGLSTGRNE